ncbi:hypothetical protein [Paraliomyxa miuraensis]|uniref:hypothetical protein n=1 Tax=Paraliomyxa miuraensis TaxID=376150 RepID=UPI00225B9A85|nr:hypothetical protein [Paraliomyxa miuraensis]MCX4243908.1 hypothetical protein [Paraliomyxa miuraensis]
MKIQALLLCLSASILLPACGAGSPDAYVEKSTKIACQHYEKCEPELWEQGMFESVNDCRDQLLDMEFDGQTLRDQFVESCTDYDRGAARKCLSAARKIKGDCDVNFDEVDEPACDEVCGAPAELGLGNPLSGELVARVLEQMEADGELGLEVEVEDELAAE